MLSVSAWWQERREGKSLTPFGAAGEAGTLERLEKAFGGRKPPASAIAKLKPWIARDVADLVGELDKRAQAERQEAERLLAENGLRESAALKTLLENQRRKVAEGIRMEDDLFDDDQERRQRQADRRSWQQKLGKLDADIKTEPDRVKAFYKVAAQRLEPVGLVYLLGKS